MFKSHWVFPASVCLDAKSNARETLVVNRYLTGPIEFIQARRGVWPENSVRGSKISSIHIGARRAYKHKKRLPELCTTNNLNYASIFCTKRGDRLQAVLLYPEAMQVYFL